MRISFPGNPNSGKTTMYNALTGKNERVGNWAGVTIGRKESPIKADYANTTEELVAVDLPGAIPCHHSHRKKVSPADTSETNIRMRLSIS